MAFLTLFWYIEELCLLAWMALLVWQGFRDENFGMPLLGLILNFSWSFSFSIPGRTVIHVYFVDQVYFLLSLIILFQVIFFGTKEFFDGRRLPLYGLITVTLIPSMGLMHALVTEEGRPWAHNQLFYIVMLITSFLFLHMLLSRGDARGQHVLASACKTAGLFCGWIYQPHAVTGWACFGALLVDTAYILLLYLCQEQPHSFQSWREFLLSTNGENSTECQQQTSNYLLVKENQADYHPVQMAAPNGETKRSSLTTLEMLTGV